MSEGSTDLLRLGAGVADLGRLEVRAGGRAPVRLTPTEARLLRYMAQRPGRVLSHRELLREVWGYGEGVRTRTLYSTVTRLRQKIEADPSSPVHLVSAPGAGYRLELPAPAELPEARALIGREALLARALAQVSEARLVTLVGPGGIGKTSLAAAAAHALAPGRALTWVELDEARTAAQLCWLVARQLGAGGDGSDPDQLAAALAARGPMVLVCDNLEQATSALPQTLGRWLAEAGELRVLATSREATGLPGERVVAVDPLDEGASVALYLRRAAAIGAAPGEGERAHLPAIAARTEGVPLVIELAASLADTLSTAAIARRLEGALGTLGGGRLLEVIGFSWELLDEEQRRFLVSCAAFEGGFTAGAAAEVAERIGAEVAPLRALVARSLAWSRRGERGPRFYLYGAVRAFAESRTEALAGARERHARWAAGVAEALLEDPSGARAGALVSDELENLLAAARFSAPAAPARAYRIARALEEALAFRRGARLRAELLEQMVALADSPARRCRAWLRRAGALRRRGRFDEADADVARALAEAKAAGLQSWIARALYGRGSQRVIQERLEEAEDDLRRALAAAKAVGDREQQAAALTFLGELHRMGGRFDRALEPLSQAVAIYRHLEDRAALINTLPSLANAHWLMGDAARSAALLDEVDALCLQLDSPVGQLRVAIHRAEQALGALELGAAGRALERGRALREELKVGVVDSFLAELEAWRAALGGDPAAATDWMRQAEVAYEAYGNRSALRRARLYRVAMSGSADRRAQLEAAAAEALERGEQMLYALARVQLAARYPEAETLEGLEAIQAPPLAGPLLLAARAIGAQAAGAAAQAAALMAEARAAPGASGVELRLLERRFVALGGQL